MKIDVMNGTRVNNRINAEQGEFVAPEQMNGRVDFLNGSLDEYMQGFTLNGFTLNALGAMDETDFAILKAIVQDKLESEDIDPAAMQGITLAAIAGAAKKAVNAVKDTIAGVKGATAAVKANIAARRGGELVEAATTPQGVEAIEQFQSAVSQEFSDSENEQRLFSSKPSLFKEPGKWFGSKKVPVIQKIGVVAGGVVLIDALTGGNIILKRAGIMKGKKRR
jgi:hypothetical protein